MRNRIEESRAWMDTKSQPLKEHRIEVANRYNPHLHFYGGFIKAADALREYKWLVKTFPKWKIRLIRKDGKVAAKHNL